MLSLTRYTRLLLIGLVLVLAAPPLCARQRTFDLAHYGVRPHPTQNASPAFRQALASIQTEVQDGDTITLRLTAGTYHFLSDGASQLSCYISNHDQQASSRAIGIYLKGWKHLRLQGQGSLLLFEERMLPLALEACSDIEVQGLTIDYPNPMITQVRILSTDSLRGTSFRTEPWVRCHVRADSIFEALGKNWRLRPSSGILFEPESKRIVYRSSDIIFPNRRIQALDSTTFLAPDWYHPRLQAGQIMALCTEERPNPACFVDRSQDVRLTKIQVRFAEGMGLLAQGSRDLTLTHFDVCPKSPADPRYFSTQADATHFSGCAGKIIVKDCLFEQMMDDALNVHGVYLRIQGRRGSHGLIAEYMHPQAWGFPWGERGDSIQLVTSATMERLGERYHITEISPLDGNDELGMKRFFIQLDRALPDELPSDLGVSIENLSRTPEVIFSHNTIRNNRARGILINTPRPVLVEGNHFEHISGSAILFSTDNNGWYESGQTQQVTIRRNTFEDILTSLFQFTTAAISIHPVIPQLWKQQTPFYGGTLGSILIEDNLFKTFDMPLLHAISTTGILWRRNELRPTATYPAFHPNRARFRLESCRSYRLE